MLINRRWEVNGDIHELHFDKYGDDTVVLTFTKCPTADGCYSYSCYDMDVICDNIFIDESENVEEVFESMYEEYLNDEIEYYKGMLEQWYEEE